MSTSDSEVPGMPLLRTAMPIPVQTEPPAATLDRSRGQVWHRSSMLLAGSMCPACLIELEKHLRELPGIAYAKVARQATAQDLSAEQTADDTAGKDVGKPSAGAEGKARAADAVIIFDNAAIKFDRLVTWIKHEKYRAFDIHDVELNGK